MTRAWTWLRWWAALAALYVTLTGKLTTVNAVAGLATGLLGAWGAVLLGDLGLARFDADTSWWAKALPLPKQVLGDSAKLAGALVRAISGNRPPGNLSRTPFDPGGDDRRSAARRALTTARVCTPPNSFVLRVEDDAMLVHQLVPSPSKGDEEWPL